MLWWDCATADNQNSVQQHQAMAPRDSGDNSSDNSKLSFHFLVFLNLLFSYNCHYPSCCHFPFHSPSAAAAPCAGPWKLPTNSAHPAGRGGSRLLLEPAELSVCHTKASRLSSPPAPLQPRGEGEWDVSTSHYPSEQRAALNVMLSLDKSSFQSNQ